MQVAFIVIKAKHNVSDVTRLVWGQDVGDDTTIVEDNNGKRLLFIDQSILINSSVRRQVELSNWHDYGRKEKKKNRDTSGSPAKTGFMRWVALGNGLILAERDLVCSVLPRSTVPR